MYKDMDLASAQNHNRSQNADEQRTLEPTDWSSEQEEDEVQTPYHHCQSKN